MARTKSSSSKSSGTRTLAKVDAELAKLRAEKEKIQKSLRELVRERDAIIAQDSQQ